MAEVGRLVPRLAEKFDLIRDRGGPGGIYMPVTHPSHVCPMGRHAPILGIGVGRGVLCSSSGEWIAIGVAVAIAVTAKVQLRVRLR